MTNELFVPIRQYQKQSNQKNNEARKNDKSHIGKFQIIENTTQSQNNPNFESIIYKDRPTFIFLLGKQ